MTYNILKFIFYIALRFYFRKIKVNYNDAIPKNKAILFVSNHQSSFMDALLIGTIVKGQLHFMSRGESFNTPLKRWIFKQFNMNPIYRKEHSPGLVSKNMALINGFQQLLLDQHSVLIFPEGISHSEPRLFPIKTGAARVILGAQAISGHEILLVPIGLNYENPHHFRSKVLVNFGNPIELKTFNKTYKKQERKAVHLLTERIGIELDQLTFNIYNKELDSLVPVVRFLYEEELIRKSPIELPKEKKAFRIQKDIIKGMHFFEKHFPARSSHIKNSLREYQQLLMNYKVKDNWLDANFQHRSAWSINDVLFYLIGFPVALYGLVNHLAIIKLPPLIAERIIKRPDFRGSLLLSYGVLCAIIFYSIQISLFAWATKSLVLTLIYLLSLPLSGYFVLHYLSKLWKDKDLLEFIRKRKNNHQILETLSTYREHLLQQLRTARQAFMAHSDNG